MTSTGPSTPASASSSTPPHGGSRLASHGSSRISLTFIKDEFSKGVAKATQTFNSLAAINTKPHEHAWSATTFADAEKCDSCKKVMEGVFNNGMWCSKCGTKLHPGCVKENKVVCNECLVARPKLSPARAISSIFHAAPISNPTKAAKDFETLHSSIRLREETAFNKWDTTTKPLLKESKKLLKKEHTNLVEDRKTLTKLARRLSKARYTHYNSFLIHFYAKINPTKSSTEIDALLQHYCKVDAPKRIYALLQKLKTSYPGDGANLVDQELKSFPPEADGLETTIHNLAQLEKDIDALSLRREEVERELLFPSLTYEGIGISPRWRARMGFEGMYAALGDLTIEEASGGGHLYVYVPSLDASKTTAQRRPIVRLIVDGGATGRKGMVNILQLDNFSSNGKALPMSYSADHLNIEAELFLQLEAEHIDVRSPVQPSGYWKLIPGSFKCDVVKIAPKIHGATIPVPESVLSTIMNLVISFILKRFGIQLIPPELGVYMKTMMKRDYEREASDSPTEIYGVSGPAMSDKTANAKRTRKGSRSSPEEWCPLECSMNFKIAGTAPLSYNKNGEDLRTIFGLSEDECTALMRAQSYLGIRRKRLFARAVDENAKIKSDAHHLTHALRNGRDWIRYYGRYLRDSLPEEKAEIIGLWKMATTIPHSDKSKLDSGGMDWPSTIPFFDRFLARLEEIDRKPVRIEMSMPKLDVKSELCGLINIWMHILVRLVHITPVFEVSRSGFHGAKTDPINAFPVQDMKNKTKGLNPKGKKASMPPAQLAAVIQERSQFVIKLIDMARTYLVDSIDVDLMSMKAANGEFSGTIVNSVCVCPMNLAFVTNGQWLSSAMRGPTVDNWPWKHELRTMGGERPMMWWGTTRTLPLEDHEASHNNLGTNRIAGLDAPLEHMRIGYGELVGNIVVLQPTTQDLLGPMKEREKNGEPEPASYFRWGDLKGTDDYMQTLHGWGGKIAKLRAKVDIIEFQGKLSCAHAFLYDLLQAKVPEEDRWILSLLLEQFRKQNTPNFLMSMDMKTSARSVGRSDLYLHMWNADKDRPAFRLVNNMSLIGLLEDFLEIFMRATRS